MKISKLLIILTLILLESCNSQTLDLDKIDFNKKPNLEGLNYSKIDHQKGYWFFNEEKDDFELKGNLESKHYYYWTKEELEQIRFSNFKLDKDCKLVEYNNKLIFASVDFDKDETFKVYNYLEEKLGSPDQTYNKLGHKIDKKLIELISKNLTTKQGVKKIVDEYDDEYLEYPEFNIWVKDNLLYLYRIANGVTYFYNNLTIISQEALLDKIVFGYHTGENLVVIGKYIK